MSKTLKEVIVAFLLTFDRGWDSTEQAHRDLLNDLDKAGFVIAPKEPTPEILAIADATALLQLTEDIEDRPEERRREEFATAYRAMIPSLRPKLFGVR
jgi:hypothetical protein